MDFLEIRRKAKERAESRARPAAPAPTAPPVDAARPAAPAVPPAAATAAPPIPSGGSDVVEAGAGRAAKDAGAPVWPPDTDERSGGDSLGELTERELARLAPLDPVADEDPPLGELTPLPVLEPAPRFGAAPAATSTPVAAATDGARPAPMHAASPNPAAPLAAPADAAAAAEQVPEDPLDEFFYREDESAPGLPHLDFAAPAAPARVEPDDRRREYLTFFLGYEEYAIEIERVREVLKTPVIADVPRAPRHVLGVIMIRGEVIAVFDPRRRLGLPDADRNARPRVVVCDDGLGPIGLAVDAVSQVVRLRRSEIAPRPQGVGNVSAEYISGIGRQGDRLFIVLDLPVVLRGKAPPAGEARA